MKCDLATLEALVEGGAVLGGGGGGSMQEGFRLARLAAELGTPKVVPLTAVDPECWVVTVSAVGAPAAADIFVKPMDYVRAVEKISHRLNGAVGGLIQNEMGGLASANGLIQSALLGIPIVDAPCNGRAHPIAMMGSLGLHKIPDYWSIQAGCGGNADRGQRIELLLEGNIYRCSVLVREGAVQAGGMLAVARNPIRAKELKEKAAIGGVTKTINLGKKIIEARRAGSSIEEIVAQSLGGDIIAQERVTRVELTTKGGFDVGKVILNGGYELAFWNEYMVLESWGNRLYTFPDLITTLDAESHQSISTAQITEGKQVFVIAVPKERLILGEGMRDRNLYHQVEQAIGKPILPFVFKGE